MKFIKLKPYTDKTPIESIPKDNVICISSSNKSFVGKLRWNCVYRYWQCEVDNIYMPDVTHYMLIPELNKIKC